jgi:hypothetical protein
MGAFVVRFTGESFSAFHGRYIAETAGWRFYPISEHSPNSFPSVSHREVQSFYKTLPFKYMLCGRFGVANGLVFDEAESDSIGAHEGP